MKLKQKVGIHTPSRVGASREFRQAASCHTLGIERRRGQRHPMFSLHRHNQLPAIPLKDASWFFGLQGHQLKATIKGQIRSFQSRVDIVDRAAWCEVSDQMASA